MSAVQNKVLVILVVMSLAIHSYAQNVKTDITVVKVGQKVPEEFWNRKHLFFMNGDTVTKTLAEYKGKVLVLDFWFSGCSTCLFHQQSINRTKKQYPEHLAVIMVNSLSPYAGMREDYSFLSKFIKTDRFKRFNIDSLESIIEDRYLKSMFPHFANPAYIWIDENGRVQMETYKNLLDPDIKSPYMENFVKSR